MSTKNSIKNKFFDAIIIGAGPAGSMTAYLLAKQGQSVLLVDKASFPRHKVCGCCLNEVAQQVLKQNGLEVILDSLKAIELNQFSLHTKHNSVQIALQNSRSLSREGLDSALIEAAIEAGACFLSQAHATVDEVKSDCCNVIIKDLEGERKLSCATAIVADGIMGRALENHPEFSTRIANGSRIGAGTVILEANSFYKPGTIYMSTASGGYVGLVRLEDNRLDIAAAFDLEFVRRAGGPAQAAIKIMTEANMPAISGLQNANWLGTAALSRSRKNIAGKRIFVIGDSSSYAEPLTGEGIAWALTSACAVVPIAKDAIKRWSPQLAVAWTKEHRRLIKTRQENSYRIARVLRNSTVTILCVELLSRFPSIAESLVQYTSSTSYTPRAIEVS
jgi:flavin-dependent dehydrogenase